MKKLLQHSLLIILTGCLSFISCKKEHSCEGCATKSNKPPIAVAGSDQVITLPADSVLLDGKQSSDPDGIISGYLWTKISGPASFNILRSSDSITEVKALVAGTYLFELKVTDNGGLFSKDTVQITVSNQSNRPPVANAGADQTITLPTNTVVLDGSTSTDPDNNITGYLWTKISGPAPFTIANANAVQTQVTNLIEGIYQFELKVTDAGNLFSKNTMWVIVNTQTPPTTCNPGNRPYINATLTQIGTLSEGKANVAVGAAGNKIVFAGGMTESDGASSVDIYDVASNNWSTAQLSIHRWGMAVTTCGNKIFFGGGVSTDGITYNDWYNNVDIYDASYNSWSVAHLSEGKVNVAATSLGNKVFFAGGYIGGFQMSSKVEIYDVTANQWSYSNLSQSRESLSAEVANNKIYFAGGNTGYTNTPNALLAYPTNRIDVYDNVSNQWSIESLSEPKWGLASIVSENIIYWAGGITHASSVPGSASQRVDIKNTNTQEVSYDCLFQVNMDFKAVKKNDQIVFFTGNGGYGSVINKFDIYDITTKSWSIGVLPFNIYGASIISVNNTIYVAGGLSWDINTQTLSYNSQVWKLEF